MTIVSAVPVTCIGPVRALARLFRYDGRLHVVAIAKTRLVFVADGPMRTQLPPDITSREAVPYRPAADVTFSGLVHVRGGKPSPHTVARLAILRPRTVGGALENAETLLNKTLRAFEVDGFGPLPSSARHALLPVEERASVDAPMPQLQSTMNFAYFHRAPTDQRTAHLRGDEWVWLERLHPSIERFASQLPVLHATGAIRVAQAETPFQMRIDTLAIDGESAWCDLLARGSFAITSEADLEYIRVIAGFEPVRSASEEAAPPADEAVTQIQRKRRDATMILEAPRERGTMILEPAPLPRERGTMILEPAADPSRAPVRRASTVILEAEEEEPGPLTVMASALDERTVSDTDAPATRAPFQLIKAGPPRSRKNSDIPGAPWASRPAPSATPVRDASFRTLDPDDAEAAALELKARLAADAEKKPAPESTKKPASKKAATWRNLPEDEAAAPEVPAAPKIKVGAPTAAVKQSIYDRFRKR